MTVDVFQVPFAAVRRRVPDRYQLAAYPGGRLTALDVWVLDCLRFPLGAPPHRRAALAMIGAVIVDPRGGSSRQALSPRSYKHYLLSAQASRAELTSWLRRAGLPAETARRLRSTQTARRRVLEVRASDSQYVVSAPLFGRRDTPHDHLNGWWHERREGRTAALELRATEAKDLYCPARLCGRIVAAPGSLLSELLGARSRRAHVSLRHLPLEPELTLLRR